MEISLKIYIYIYISTYNRNIYLYIQLPIKYKLNNDSRHLVKEKHSTINADTTKRKKRKFVCAMNNFHRVSHPVRFDINLKNSSIFYLRRRNVFDINAFRAYFFSFYFLRKRTCLKISYFRTIGIYV